MPAANLAYDLIEDIPWEESPALSFGTEKEATAYLLAFEDLAESFAVKGTRISFRSDVWDFNPYIDGVNDGSHKLHFSSFPNEIAIPLKFMALRDLGRKKIPTLYTRISAFKSIILGIFEKTEHTTFDLITTDDIVTEIERRDIEPGTAKSLYTSAYQCWQYLIRECRMDLLVDIEQLQRLSIEKDRRARANMQDRKTPDIPSEYFEAILSAAIRVMRDSEGEYDKRATACLLLILTQLGLRPSDLLALRTWQLRTKKLSASGITANFIRYKSRKPSKAGGPALEFDVTSNALCTEAFRTLESIRTKCPLATDSDFLYVLDPTYSSKNILPVSEHRFKGQYHRFLLQELPDLCMRDWESVTTKKIKVGHTKFVRISAPTPTQFRVHLCTTLYEKGVSLLYIQRYMGHLSEDMIGYYARPKDTYQESVRYAEEIIKSIVVEDARLIGGRFGDEVKTNIEEFVEQGAFNVETDLHGIIEAFGPNLIIRGKRGGTCIKDSMMPCTKDVRTNELLCAYDLCPNLFHFYYNADISYMDFLTLQKTHDAMALSGKTYAAEKELYKLKDLCSRRLLPELNELEREIGRKGREIILNQHPELLVVMENIEGIRGEIDTWMKR